jgi:hypothetical protein
MIVGTSKAHVSLKRREAVGCPTFDVSVRADSFGGRHRAILLLATLPR